MWQKAELGFRKQSHEGIGSADKNVITDDKSSDALIAQANRYILNTADDMIQSKIRALLVGTELEDIAKSA